MAPLRDLDKVVDLRFASGYQAFDSLDDCQTATTLLRAERKPTGMSVAPGSGDH
ncbi:hypothetical protein ACQE98_16925 [Ornithinimicrobium sp. W1679]|uniref:hypothetical protein n=1 Tax=Ornithinimicrobium sp. W1679 TaxID=3418770 RepID=UPI003CF94542